MFSGGPSAFRVWLMNKQAGKPTHTAFGAYLAKDLQTYAEVSGLLDVVAGLRTHSEDTQASQRRMKEASHSAHVRLERPIDCDMQLAKGPVTYELHQLAANMRMHTNKRLLDSPTREEYPEPEHRTPSPEPSPKHLCNDSRLDSIEKLIRSQATKMEQLICLQQSILESIHSSERGLD